MHTASSYTHQGMVLCQWCVAPEGQSLKGATCSTAVHVPWAQAADGACSPAGGKRMNFDQPAHSPTAPYRAGRLDQASWACLALPAAMPLQSPEQRPAASPSLRLLGATLGQVRTSCSNAWRWQWLGSGAGRAAHALLCHKAGHASGPSSPCSRAAYMQPAQPPSAPAVPASAEHRDAPTQPAGQLQCRGVPSFYLEGAPVRVMPH